MKRILFVFFASIAVFSVFLGYHFTEYSIQNRTKEIVVNSDTCLFFSSSSELGERKDIYCSDKRALDVIRDSTLGITGVPTVTNETLKKMSDIVVFETFSVKNKKSSTSTIKLYQYGYLFEIKPKEIFDVPAYSLAVKRAESGARYR
ncbi:hypothetical protein [Salinivibrio kushneri]|uniref:hypothetical protein n=1 Tax=Salinivibrio kushneri TaxID=1908198 RepID=UPI000C847C7C|nr:hypothetical protein [Salinivibrio kushneri]